MLWVEMPEGTDSVRLYQRAFEQGIGIAPGSIFTLGEKYRNCIRLSSAFWDERSERGVQVLGRLAGEVADASGANDHPPRTVRLPTP